MMKEIHKTIQLKTILILLFVINIEFWSGSLSAAVLQLRSGETIDMIVAIVGNEIIMKSTLEGEIMLMAERDKSIDITDKKLRQSVLDELINRKILITKAEEDSITVSDDIVEERWEIYKNDLLNYFGSIERIEAVYKKSINRLKLEVRDEIKKMLLAQQLENQHFGNVVATDKDVEEFYSVYRDSLPNVPEQMELYHIVRYIYPDTTSKLNTYTFAKNVRDSIINKTLTFEQAVEKYSMDYGSSKSGGDLGWVSKGKFVQEFERAAFLLQPDEISLPVESPFGFHIIQTLEKAKDSIHTRHILFKVIQSDNDVGKVKSLLDSLKSVATDENFSKLAMEFSEEKEAKGFGGGLGKFTINEYPPSIVEAVKGLKDGEISDPAMYQIDPTKPGMNIVYRKATIPEHKPNIEQDYNFLKRYALEFKKLKLKKEWLNKLRQEIYWEVMEQ